MATQTSSCEFTIVLKKMGDLQTAIGDFCIIASSFVQRNMPSRVKDLRVKFASILGDWLSIQTILPYYCRVELHSDGRFVTRNSNSIAFYDRKHSLANIHRSYQLHRLVTTMKNVLEAFRRMRASFVDHLDKLRIRGLSRLRRSFSAMFICSMRVITSVYKYFTALNGGCFRVGARVSTYSMYEGIMATMEPLIHSVERRIRNRRQIIRHQIELARASGRHLTEEQIIEHYYLPQAPELDDAIGTRRCFAIFMEGPAGCRNHYHVCSGGGGAGYIIPDEDPTMEDGTSARACVVNTEGLYCGCFHYTCRQRVAENRDKSDHLNSGHPRRCFYYQTLQPSGSSEQEAGAN